MAVHQQPVIYVPPTHLVYVDNREVIRAVTHPGRPLRKKERKGLRAVDWTLRAEPEVGMTLIAAMVAARSAVEGASPHRPVRPFRWKQNETSEIDLLVGNTRGDQRGKQAKRGKSAPSVDNPQEVLSLVSHREKVYGRAMTMPDSLRVSSQAPNLAITLKR